MKINGFQYYWMIFSGLLFGLLGGLIASLNEEFINSSSVYVLLALFLFIFPAICYLVVFIEMWSRIRWWLVAVALASSVAASVIHPAFQAVYSLAPLAYWLSRINGIKSASTNT